MGVAAYPSGSDFGSSLKLEILMPLILSYRKFEEAGSFKIKGIKIDGKERQQKSVQ